MKSLPRLLFAVTFWCAACTSPAADDVEQSADALVTNPEARLRVVQCNLEDGGRYTDGKGSVTYDTAKRFATLMASTSINGAAVIGMEEIWNDDEPRRLIAEKTGHEWKMRNYPQGIHCTGSGIAVLWRPDLVTMKEDFGTVDVATLDNGYVVRFGGALFEKNGTTREFGFFTGKLTWDGATIGGRATDDELRAAQARTLRTWVQSKMSAHPRSARIITMDMNGDHGTPVWDAMSEEYWDDDVADATHDSHYDLLLGKRYDYIWWDYDAGARNTNGFYERPHRSEHFGSDHRFVWADVFLRN